MYLPVQISIFAILVIAFCDNSNAAESACEPGWGAFEEDKCFKVLDNVLGTFDEAESACAKLADGPATLPIVHTKAEQDFLSNFLFYTHKKVDNFWLGAKAQGTTNIIKWIDNTALTFANWDTRTGRHLKAHYCLQMQSDEALIGKWIDEPCERKNGIVCVKTQTWSLARMQKAFQETQSKLRELEHKLLSSSVPVGFIYAQLPQTAPPTELWPSVSWKDVSSYFEGVFFRVAGGGAASFGGVQQENLPTISNLTIMSDGPSQNFTGHFHTYDKVLKMNSKSPEYWYGNHYLSGIAVGVNTGEVRPRNMAIRIWQRNA